MTLAEDNPTYVLGSDKTTFRRYRLVNDIYQPATIARVVSLGLPPDAHVLEVGCGIGDTARWLANEVVPDGHVTAFDQSADLIDVARDQAGQAGVSNVTFTAADALQIDLGLDSFDFAHSRAVLTYIPGAADVVDKIFAALKPGGIFLGEELTDNDFGYGRCDWFTSLYGWFAQMCELAGGNPVYGIDALPADMLHAGFMDLKVTAEWPRFDREKTMEMLRLALANEMADAIVQYGLGTREEVDAAIAGITDPDPGIYLALPPMAQVSGCKPA